MKNKFRDIISKYRLTVYVVALGLTILAGLMIYGVFKKTDPLLVFNDNVVFEYGSNPSKSEIINTIINDGSIYDEILEIQDFNTMDINYIQDNDTTVNAPNTANVVAKKGDVEEIFTFEYYIFDTSRPSIKGPSNLKVDQGEYLNLAMLYEASDVIDGSLPVWIDGNYDLNAIGEYVVQVKTQDRNNNSNTLSLTLTVSSQSDVGYPMTINDTLMLINESMLKGTKLEQETLRDKLVLKKDIIISENELLSSENIFDLKASGLEAKDVLVKHATVSKSITKFGSSEDVINRLLFSDKDSCITDSLKIIGNKSYGCDRLLDGTYGLTLIDGAGYREAYITNPLIDKVVVSVNGVEVSLDITYHRQLIGTKVDLLRYYSSTQ